MAYTADMMRKVVTRALEVGILAADDPRKQRVKIVGFDFDLLTGGRCQEFVRECFESALGWPARWREKQFEWSWGIAYGYPIDWSW